MKAACYFKEKRKLKWLASLFRSIIPVATEKVVDAVIDEVKKTTHKEPESTSTRKKPDLTPFTKPQLRHLLDVYENSRHGVKTYADLAKYGNNKYGFNKTPPTYYQNLDKYRKQLEEKKKNA